MTEAATLLAMLAVMVATVFATRLARDKGFTVIAMTTGAALAVFSFLGVNTTISLDVLAPVLMIIGYAAVAGVLESEGVTAKLAVRLGPGPLPVLLGAAVASVLLSNDIVIVAFAVVVLSRPHPARDAAALFVGANVTGGFLPQGSPTNLLLLGDRSFFSYVHLTAPITVAMLLTATVVFWVVGRLIPDPPPAPEPAALESTYAAAGKLAIDGASAVDDAAPLEGSVVPAPLARWTAREKMLIAFGVVAIAAQPACTVLGISRGVLGWILLLCAAGLAWALGYPIGQIMARAPWQIVAVVLVLSTGAASLSVTATEIAGNWAWALTTFLVSSTGTDILAAALAAPDVLDGVHNAGAGLVAVTAGAFATPLASIAGILLLGEHQREGVPVRPLTFLLAGAAAALCFVVGVGTALVLS